jgi:hypothetical protein
MGDMACTSKSVARGYISTLDFIDRFIGVMGLLAAPPKAK